MTRSKMLRRGALCALVTLTIAACDGDGAELTTTSSLLSSPTSAAESPTTSVAPGGASTTTTLVGEPVGDSEIVARESEAAGETLYIVVPPGAYTDVDIENFVLDLIEDGVASFGAEIFDDDAAVEAYRTPEAERTDEQSALVDQHHFASLVDGTTIEFRGPFEDSGSLVIGS